MALTIRFRAAYAVNGLLLNPAVRFAIGPWGEHALEVHLWRQETDGGTVELEAFCGYQLNDSREAMFRLLETGKLPEGSEPDPKDSRIQPDRSFDPETVLPLHYLPKSFQNIHHDVRPILHEAADRTLRLLRWRYRKQCAYELVAKPGLAWESPAKGRWFRFPSHLPAPGLLRVETGMSHHAFLKDFLTDRLESQRDEPLGHRLLQNAYRLVDFDPQAAIVLAVTAIEVGVKDVIAARVPQAHWLVFRAPTPPVEKIIQEYVPTLFPHIPAALFPKDIVDNLRKHIHCRNEVSHTGAAVTRDQACRACADVSELLYRLDFLGGEAWAKPAT